MKSEILQWQLALRSVSLGSIRAGGARPPPHFFSEVPDICGVFAVVLLHSYGTSEETVLTDESCNCRNKMV